jgi:hypothetical protein
MFRTCISLSIVESAHDFSDSILRLTQPTAADTSESECIASLESRNNSNLGFAYPYGRKFVPIPGRDTSLCKLPRNRNFLVGAVVVIKTGASRREIWSVSQREELTNVQCHS